MIAEELRQSILTLHRQGQALRDISRILKVSRNTVRRVLRHREPRSRQNHPKHPAIGPQLAEIYRRCRGNGVRIQEILKDEHGIEVRRAP